MEKEIAAYLKHYLFVIAMAMPRITVAFSILPFFGRTVSMRVRNSLAFCFAILLYPVVDASCPKNPDMLFTILVVFKEAILGFLLGYALSMVFWAAESIGFVVDNQRGANLAAVFDPLFGEQTSILGNFMVQLMAVLFFTSGGFLIMLSGIFESYKVWPVFSFFPKFDRNLALFFLKQVDNLMEITVVLSAPILIAIFISEFGLGLINRFAPQLNVFFLSMPIKSGVACFFLILYLVILYTHLRVNLTNLDKTIEFIRSVITGG